MAATSTSSFNKIEKAHQLYRDGRHEEALGFYTDALAIAKNKPQKIALHSNRAACYLKLHDFNKAAEECTSVLELDHNHTGALMLRAQTLVTLKEYQSALFDVNRLMELNPSSDVYLNLQSRLKTQLALTPIPESEEEALAADLEEEEEEMEAALEETVEAELEDEEVVGEAEEAAIVAEVDKNKKIMSPGNNPEPLVNRTSEDSSDMHPQGWEAVPKPKGHSRLDYSRWDKVEDDLSEEEDEAEDSRPQYRFRLKTVGVRPVK